mmetsp:Transcript_14355/g.35003  ORF Transcript_14355/g.35003 Transcript_14355/m.35003 type:complete len:172 (-) Transcript_14355:534-1049(-)
MRDMGASVSKTQAVRHTINIAAEFTNEGLGVPKKIDINQRFLGLFTSVNSSAVQKIINGDFVSKPTSSKFLDVKEGVLRIFVELLKHCITVCGKVNMLDAIFTGNTINLFHIKGEIVTTSAECNLLFETSISRTEMKSENRLIFGPAHVKHFMFNTLKHPWGRSQKAMKNQ